MLLELISIEIYLELGMGNLNSVPINACDV